jgi:hypothetical protein
VSEEQFVMRAATHQGSKHRQLHVNNQDAKLAERFAIPAWNKRFMFGVVSDGCTGFPAFSRTEVGANLLSVFSYSRVQELACAGIPIAEIPRVLFQSVTEFIRHLANLVMPSTVHWPYPVRLKDRDGVDSATRFRLDYLAATLLGFIADGELIVTFSAGDGIILVNDDLTVIDQDDRPEYPARSIHAPGSGFQVRTYRMADVRRLAVMTDGPKDLVQERTFVDDIFAHKRGNAMGLQILLNIMFDNHPEKLLDDCTIVAFERATPGAA